MRGRGRGLRTGLPPPFSAWHMQARWTSWQAGRGQKRYDGAAFVVRCWTRVLPGLTSDPAPHRRPHLHVLGAMKRVYGGTVQHVRKWVLLPLSISAGGSGGLKRPGRVGQDAW